MAHPSQSSLTVSLPTYANITGAAAVSTVSCLANQRDLGAYSAEGVYLVTSGSELIMVWDSDFYVEGGRTYLRKPPATAFTAYVITACYDPAFVIPEWARGVIVENPNASAITIRKGPPNAFGYTIASYTDYVGDANADGVIGFSIAPYAQFVLDRVDIQPGDKWHLLASAGSLKAVVNFF